MIAACATAYPPPGETTAGQTQAHRAFLVLKNDLNNASSDAELLDFVEAFHTAMFSDMPFKPDARYEQLQELTEYATDPSNQRIQILAAIEEAVDREIRSGKIIEQWSDTVETEDAPLRPYTHFGRLALIRDTANGFECFDMAEHVFVPITDVQKASIDENMVSASDLTPNRLPAGWPCQFDRVAD
jgi:hypothetical protein